MNASGTYRLKPVIVGKVAKPCALMDCMHELPVVYYNTNNAWFTIPMFSDCFLNIFVPVVQHYQENELHIVPEDVKALLLDSTPVHLDAEKLESAVGKICTMFLPPNTTSIMQSMDLGVIVSCKRFYQWKYLDDVLVVIDEEEDLEEDARGQRTLKNRKTYYIKSAI